MKYQYVTQFGPPEDIEDEELVESIYRCTPGQIDMIPILRVGDKIYLADGKDTDGMGTLDSKGGDFEITAMETAIERRVYQHYSTVIWFTTYTVMPVAEKS